MYENRKDWVIKTGTHTHFIVIVKVEQVGVVWCSGESGNMTNYCTYLHLKTLQTDNQSQTSVVHPIPKCATNSSSSCYFTPPSTFEKLL